MSKLWRAKRDMLNVGSLAAIQGFNAITPLIIFPKLLIELGAAKFSVLVVAESLSFFILTAVLFSFEISGVRDIAQAHQAGDRSAMAKKFMEILVTRVFIYLLFFLLIGAALLLTHLEEAIVLLCWSMLSLGLALQSGYYFQATENNLPVAIVTAISRCALLGFVFLKVDTSWPSYLPALLIGLSYLASGTACLLIALFGLRGCWMWPSWNRIWHCLADGRHIFMGNVFLVVTRDTSVFYLRLLGFPPGAISSFSLAEKVLKSLQAIIRPLNQHYFARSMRKIQIADKPNLTTLRIIMTNTYPQMAVVMVAIIVFVFIWGFYSDELKLRFALPIEFDAAIQLLIFMVPTAIIGVFNFMAGIAGLNNLGESRKMARALWMMGIAYAVGLYALSTLIGIQGAALNITLAELFLAGLVLSSFWRHDERQKSESSRA